MYFPFDEKLQIYPQDDGFMMRKPWDESKIPEEKRKVLMQILSQDPRPSYQNDPERVYGMGFAGFEVKFRVEGSTLYVVSVTKKQKE